MLYINFVDTLFLLMFFFSYIVQIVSEDLKKKNFKHTDRIKKDKFVFHDPPPGTTAMIKMLYLHGLVVKLLASCAFNNIYLYYCIL